MGERSVKTRIQSRWLSRNRHIEYRLGRGGYYKVTNRTGHVLCSARGYVSPQLVAQVIREET